jgi:hypothetical protein
VSRAPEFRSAVLVGDGTIGALPPRRVSRSLGLSLAAHAVLGGWFVVLLLSGVEPVPPPPLTIRFFAQAPPPPEMVPLREESEPPPPPRPVPPPADTPPLIVQPPPPPAEPRPEPEPLRLEPEPPPIRVADAAPEIAVHDIAPGSSEGPALAPLGAVTTPQAGAGEEPSLAFLTPGERVRSSGGGIAGRDRIAVPPSGDPLGSIRRGGKDGPGGGDGAVGKEGAFTGTGLASFLGRRYGVTLTEASRLGSRTSDGARYALLVPALSEAMRAIRFRGRRTGPPGDPVESIQVDAEAVAIRYRDGTVHVLAPTPDGLVALFVSAKSAAGRSKVQEAERALMALQRLGARETRG